MKTRFGLKINFLCAALILALWGVAGFARAQSAPANLVPTELARKAAQAYVDTIAKDLPDIYQGASVNSEPTICYDLEGQPSAYLFDVMQPEGPVGFALTGNDQDGPVVYMVSAGASPTEMRRIYYESEGFTKRALADSLSKGQGRILYIRGLDFYMEAPNAAQKNGNLKYIRLRDGISIHPKGIQTQQAARVAGIAAQKKLASFRKSWQRISEFQPAGRGIDPAKAATQKPATMTPMMRVGDRLVPLPKNLASQAPPPDIDFPMTINLPVGKGGVGVQTNLERGQTYALTYNSQNVPKFNIDRWYVSPFEGNPLVYVDNVATNVKRDLSGRYLWTIASRHRPEYQCRLSMMDADNPLIYYISSEEFYLSASRTLNDVRPMLTYRAEAATVEAMNLTFLGKKGFPDLYYPSREFYWEGIFCDAPKELVDIIAKWMNVDEFGFGGRGGVSLDQHAAGVRSTVYELGYGWWPNRFASVYPPESPVTIPKDPQAHIFREIIDRKRTGQMGFPGSPPEHSYDPGTLYLESTCLMGFAFHTNTADPESRILYIYFPSWDRNIIALAYEAQNGPDTDPLFDYHELVPPDMVVKYPNTAETYLAPGQNIKIKWGSWASQTGHSKVKIELYRKGTRISTIASGVSNSGSYSWIVPTGLTPASDYRIKVTSTSGSSVYDYSDKYFSVVSGRSVLAPATSGVIWRKGQSYEIRWRGFVGSNVRIDLYRNGVYARTIVSSTPNDGSYLWTVPESVPSASGFSIRVMETSNTAQYANSSASFVIQSWPKVLAPNLNRTYRMGAAYDITWSGFTGTTVSIALFIGSSHYTTVTASTPNDGSYRWVIPLTYPSGGGYKVKITSRGVGAVADYDFSDQPFVIYIPELFVGGSPVLGSIDSSSDVDFYRFMLPVPSLISLDTSASVLSDTVMHLYGPPVTAGPSRTGDGLQNQRDLLSAKVTAAVPGVNDSIFNNQIEVDDDDGAQQMSRIDRPLFQLGQYYFVKVRPYTTDLRGAYYVKLTTMSAPQIFINSFPWQSRIQGPGDVDWTTFSITSAGFISIETFVETLPAAKMTLYDSRGQQIVSLRSAAGDARIYRFMPTGLYYLKTESGIEDGIGSFRIVLSQQ